MVSGWGIRMYSRAQTFLEKGIQSYAHVSEELGQKAEVMERKRNRQPRALRKENYLCQSSGLWSNPIHTEGGG